MRVAVTGAAGFIGAKVAFELLGNGHEVVAIDNFDETYSAALKRDRIRRLEENERFRLIIGDIRDVEDVAKLIATEPDTVVHLAAQGGLRKSMDEPAVFISANISGFGNVIKATVDAGIGNLVYASSGAVYGGTPALPFRENDPASWPLSLYGATKRCDELLALVYAHAGGLRCTGLRFSTVYGTDGRPDMAMYTFADRISRGEAINVHGHGRMVRDFLWGDDAAHVVVLAAEDDRPFRATPLADGARGELADAPWRVLNVATGRPCAADGDDPSRRGCGRSSGEAQHDRCDAGRGHENRMDVDELERTLGFRPQVMVEEGVPQAVAWYLEHLDRSAA